MISEQFLESNLYWSQYKKGIWARMRSCTSCHCCCSILGKCSTKGWEEGCQVARCSLNRIVLSLSYSEMCAPPSYIKHVITKNSQFLLILLLLLLLLSICPSQKTWKAKSQERKSYRRSAGVKTTGFFRAGQILYEGRKGQSPEAWRASLQREEGVLNKLCIENKLVLGFSHELWEWKETISSSPLFLFYNFCTHILIWLEKEMYQIGL